MVTPSSTLAWRIPKTEEPGGLQSWGHKELNVTWQLSNNNTLCAGGSIRELNRHSPFPVGFKSLTLNNIPVESVVTKVTLKERMEFYENISKEPLKGMGPHGIIL